MTTARRRGTRLVSPEDGDDDGLARHYGCCAEVIHLTNLPNHPPWIAARGHLAGYPPQCFARLDHYDLLSRRVRRLRI